jgi:hypothetical protein
MKIKSVCYFNMLSLILRMHYAVTMHILFINDKACNWKWEGQRLGGHNILGLLSKSVGCVNIFKAHHFAPCMGASL